MTYKAETVEKYIAQIPKERQEPFQKLRSVILEHLPTGFEECIQWDMPTFVVPFSRYPDGYHCSPKLPLPFLSLASQKNYIALYHMGIYSMPDLLDWFRGAWPGPGKLDMGKSCIRLKKINQIPFDLLGDLVSRISVEQWIGFYEDSVKNRC